MRRHLGFCAADLARSEILFSVTWRRWNSGKRLSIEGKVEENVDNLVNSLIKEGVSRG